MRPGILCLDVTADKSVRKALGRHGDVYCARSITEALHLMVEHLLDYYFIDADLPDARAFINHIRHDPQLAPPLGIVLLTDNLDEDSEAWRVDTFITRDRFGQDVPYVFSHLVGDDPEPANVVRIAPGGSEKPRSSEISVPSSSRKIGSRPPLGRITANEETAAENADSAQREEAEPERLDFSRAKGGGIYKAAALVALLALIALWLLAWGPLSKKAHVGERTDVRSKSVEAVSPEQKDGESGEPQAPYEQTPLTSAAPVGQQASSPAANVTVPATADGSRSGQITPATVPAPAPAPPPENRAPSASISGPSTLRSGETGYYTASGSDPDGDSFTLSWTSRPFNSSNPGHYSLSVTVTDSRGATSSASIGIQVIP